MLAVAFSHSGPRFSQQSELSGNRAKDGVPLAIDERHSARSVWQGTKSDLEEVLAVVGEVRNEAVQDLQRELDAARDEREQSRRKTAEHLKGLMVPSDRVIFTDDRTRDAFNASIETLVEQAETLSDTYRTDDAEKRIDETSVRVYDLRKSGHGVENEPSAVLPTMHPRKTRDLEIKFGGFISGRRLSVKFERLGGVKVTAASPNSLWVSGALNRLDSVLSQKRPWYAFLSSWWVCVPLCFIIALLSTAQVIAWLGVPPDDGFYWMAGIFGIGGFLFTAWTTFLFPKFELYNSGSQPAVKAIVGALLVVAGLLPLVDLFSPPGT